jgi:D-glycero-D-manno-heptose 1,7-bisphosphate phosphatase
MTGIQQATFLVGGRGTRLGSLTQSTPKPLLKVGGAPFIELLITEAARYGFTDILLLAGHLAESVMAYDGRRFLGASVKVLVEPGESGTAGALVHAKDHLAQRFILANGDSFFDINLLALTRDEGPAPAARLALRSVEDAGRYGAVSLTGNKITGFHEKGTTGPGLINAGIYVLNRDIVGLITGMPSSIEKDIFPQLVANGTIEGRVFDGAFIDIGIPSDFDRAQTLIPSLKARPMAFLDRDGVINRDHGYAYRPDQIEFMPGAIDAIKMLNDRGFYVCVVTNQAGIARGFYSAQDVLSLHRWMNTQFGSHGAHIDSFHFCPHHPSEGTGPLTGPCACRKPAPGLLEDAAEVWRPRKDGSFLVGDKDSDLAAARAYGVPGYFYDGLMPLDRFIGDILDRQNDAG